MSKQRHCAEFCNCLQVTLIVTCRRVGFKFIPLVPTTCFQKQVNVCDVFFLSTLVNNQHTIFSIKPFQFVKDLHFHML